VGVAVAATFAAGAPGAAWGKGKHHGKKDDLEVVPAAEATTTPPEPAPEAAPLNPPPAPTPTAPVAPPPVTPMVDASGRLLYGPPSPGMGSVTVKGDKVQVTFDGRSFGTAPLIIYNVPKGDYVVEGIGPSGTEISRPVSVEENGQATVDLGALQALSAANAARLVEGSSGRLPLASKILLGVGGAGLAVGIVFGVLEWKAHRDYESAPADQGTLDGLAHTGLRDAMVANVGFIACGASLLASGLIALPSLIKGETPARDAGSVTVTASAAPGAAMAGVSLRF
jgi:hypothetical protein